MIKHPTIGEISSGTLREIDLVKSFGRELDRYLRANTKARELNGQRRKLSKLVHMASKATEGGRELDWLMKELSHALNNAAGPYAYFGTLDGDDACFGFWTCMEYIRQNVDLELPAGTTPPNGFRGDILYVNDHGNVMVTRVTRGKEQVLLCIV